ncbi:MAG: DUF4396 domain-containing protein [Rikenellaceae bacterium]
MTLSVISLSAAIISAIIIAIDLWRKPQSMRIMNAVWVLTALWGSVLGLVAYFWFGRERNTMSMDMGGMSMGDMKMPQRAKWQSVTLSTLHCGAGCTLADILGSMVLFVIPMSLGGGWAFTYVLALVIGVYFQFVAIREMSSDSTSTILKRAIKADFLSLTSWQVGMYGWLALLMFHFHSIPTASTMSYDFWFAMQQAMVAGFVLALPMNYLLIRTGVKSGM